MDYLLYANCVALIADKFKMAELLQLCEQHSIELDFHWSPGKCPILDKGPQSL